jgi:hypothetical protein
MWEKRERCYRDYERSRRNHHSSRRSNNKKSGR